MEIIAKVMRSDSWRRRIEMALLLLLVLAYTLPFIGQAIHIDAHLNMDWARQELSHPIWQHIPNYDYFGVHYDEFHDTHPRLLTLYYSLLIRIADGVSVPLLHLAMIPFPVIAALSTYWLARRFQVNAFVAALLLLIAPAFLVNTHLLMTDVPGISMWLAGMTLFIYGVDRNRISVTLMAVIPLTLSIFIYYQGLSALPLALLYLFLQRKVSGRNVISLAIPAILFFAFVVAHVAYYSQLPTFSYPFGLPMDVHSVVWRIRGVATLIGGVVIFPVLGVWLFPKSRSSVYATGGVFIASTFWVALLFMRGDLPIEDVFLLPLFLASGMAIIWFVTSRFFRGFMPAFSKKTGADQFWLLTWILGITFYCAILLPYPSPRYLIPLIPPAVIITTKLLQERWGNDRKKFISQVTWIAVATFILSTIIAVGEHQRANTNPVMADWVVENLHDAPGKIWFNGGLGYQYYMEQNHYHMLIKDSDDPAPGDLIAESVHNNRWGFGVHLLKRVELVNTVDFPRNWPIITENFDYKTSWLGNIGLTLPFGTTGAFVDRLYVYRVVCKPGDMIGEEGVGCIPFEEEAEDKNRGMDDNS